MSHAVRLTEIGGPEVLKWVEVDVPKPGKGEVLLRHTAIGVNFLDVYYRKGVYPPPGGFPLTPGGEGAGVVEAVGEGVTSLKPGDRVVYQTSIGAYAEERLMPADRLVKIPDGVDDQTAAAAFLKGVTAQVLLYRTFKVEKGMTVLWHAAAGGVGSIACQWAAALGATVIGTVGSDDKKALAKSYGCHHVLNYRTDDVVARVKELTGGAGVEVVYDSVGVDTFQASMDSLKRLGMLASFGQSSGLPPPFTMAMLQQRGALFATRPSVTSYLITRPELEAAANSLFAALEAGHVKVAINQKHALKDAAEAHRALEARKTVGSTVLMP